MAVLYSQSMLVHMYYDTYCKSSGIKTSYLQLKDAIHLFNSTHGAPYYNNYMRCQTRKENT